LLIFGGGWELGNRNLDLGIFEKYRQTSQMLHSKLKVQECDARKDKMRFVVG